jgi:hypothetical protein
MTGQAELSWSPDTDNYTVQVAVFLNLPTE